MYIYQSTDHPERWEYRSDFLIKFIDILLNLEFRTNGMLRLSALVRKILALRMTDVGQTFLQKRVRIVFQ